MNAHHQRSKGDQEIRLFIECDILILKKGYVSYVNVIDEQSLWKNYRFSC